MVVIDEKYIFPVDVVLREIVNFPVEKISIAEIAAGKMLNVVGEVFWWGVVVLRVC